MKFNSQYDPDPIRSKFHSIDSILEIPDEKLLEINNAFHQLLGNLEILKDTVESQKKKGFKSNFKKESETIIRYAALMQVQITDIQHTLETNVRNTAELAKVVHELIERLQKNGIA